MFADEYAGAGAENACPFSEEEELAALAFRDSPYWHTLLTSRHIGVHRPDARICNWTARLLTVDKRYVQKCLGPALDTGRGRVDFRTALERAFTWFHEVEAHGGANIPKPVGRVSDLNVCPYGDTYSVGHALKDYTDWTRLARSPGGHYNNLVLINHHITPKLAQVPLEEFSARHLVELARHVLDTPPRFGFAPYRSRCPGEDLSPDEVRRRKRTFNSLVSILRMAFRHAWDSGHIESERPWRSLRRIPVAHAPRTLFLTREECHRLLERCTPALRDLVLAALYTGCRVGELAALRVEDVGREAFGVHVRPFKRGPGRFVFLPAEGMSFFLRCCEGKDARDRVLLSDKGKVWQKQHTNLFRRAVSEAGLPSAFVFHGLRHTYASDLVRSGATLDVVAKQLGHASTRTVSDTYGHLSGHFREEQVQTMFSPLSAEYIQASERQANQLANMRECFQKRDWRAYGRSEGGSSHPRQAYGAPAKGVLQVFAAAEAQ